MFEDYRTRGAGYDIRLVDCGRGRIYVNRLQDAKTEMRPTRWTVKMREDRPRGNGVNSAVMGRTADRFGFFASNRSSAPPTIYRLDTATGKREFFFPNQKIDLRFQPV